MKNNKIIIFSSVLLLVSCSIYLYINRNARGENIECTSNIESYYDNLHFQGEFTHKLYDRFGSVLVTGVIKKGKETIGNVNRRVNVQLQRSDSIIMLTSTRIIKKEGDTASPDDIKKTLPTYISTDGGVSLYDFIRQDDGAFLLFRGNIPFAYCSN